jgi:hypothetical protein
MERERNGEVKKHIKKKRRKEKIKKGNTEANKRMKEVAHKQIKN